MFGALLSRENFLHTTGEMWWSRGFEEHKPLRMGQGHFRPYFHLLLCEVEERVLPKFTTSHPYKENEISTVSITRASKFETTIDLA